ncbi:hypothetical protein [Sulfurovum sp. AR]|uniref:hypothetical protein n=1 Tax=Sulfurovum sp. AR TaxID=1165841 RepID=UPI00025C4E99|nr:hypothetical protein [Sulfurovum sp. AR]EIF50630.1 hypothetical protein SULAR_07435 [Sulfurovum sp. AR]
MKKTLLLSVVASTMIMAGGDIAPVEPVVEAPAAASAWEFSGNAVVYYQSNDYNTSDVFDQESSLATAGIELRATNSDVFAGIGAGVAVNGVSTLNLENFMVDGVMQGAGNNVAGNDVDDITDGGWISEAYLTYGFGNTGIKAGRQTLPKALSPFAHSENWNVFKNTYDAVTVVNTDITDTTLVYAFVYGANQNGYGTNMSDFNHVNNDKTAGVHMLTAQNKSFEGLTLTGTWYHGADHLQTETEDMDILWGDARFTVAGVNVALQGGSVMGDAIAVNPEDTTAFGAQAGYDFGMINASVAYSTVNDGDLGVFNIGGQQTVLYTQMIINEGAIASDNDTWVVRADMDALGGNFAAAYGMTSDNSAANLDYNEFDLTYTTNVFENVNIAASYVNMDTDVPAGAADINAENLVRFVARYNF